MTAVITATGITRTAFYKRHIFRSIDRSLRPTGRISMSYLASSGIFMRQGRRTQS